MCEWVSEWASERVSKWGSDSAQRLCAHTCGNGCVCIWWPTQNCCLLYQSKVDNCSRPVTVFTDTGLWCHTAGGNDTLLCLHQGCGVGKLSDWFEVKGLQRKTAIGFEQCRIDTMYNNNVIQKDYTCCFPSLAAVIGGNINARWTYKSICLFSWKLSFKGWQSILNKTVNNNWCINLSLFHIQCCVILCCKNNYITHLIIKSLQWFILLGVASRISCKMPPTP